MSLAILLLAGSCLAALVVAPAQVGRVWRVLGFPANALDRIAARLPGQAATNLIVPEEPVVLTASGTLQAEETRIAAEIGGRVTQVLAEEGEPVKRGQVLVRLDDAVLQAQRAEADQAVQAARANLALARAGARPGAVDASNAAVRQAQATLEGALQGAKDARRARDELQELDEQIHRAQSRVTLATRQIEQARAQQAAIGARRDSIAGDGSDQGKTQWAIYDKQWAAAAETIAAAEQEARGAQRVVGFLQEVRSAPVALDAAVRAAEGQATLAEAGLVLADSASDLASAGPRPEAVALAAAKVAQAEAAVQVLRVQAEKATIASPLDGVVISRSIQPGESASPGVPLLAVADLKQMTLVAYVPEPRLGEVAVGQEVLVSVDAFPGRAFHGVVGIISSRAEFTPRTIQTQEERAETVFAVEVKLENTDGSLKPGMPADAEFVQR
jgi:multidrug resistance efflux pump